MPLSFCFHGILFASLRAGTQGNIEGGCIHVICHGSILESFDDLHVAYLDLPFCV